MSTHEKQKPKGKLIIIGGKEAKKPEKSVSLDNKQNVDFSDGILTEVINELMKDSPLIEVIPVASEDQEDVGKKYIAAFKKLHQKANVMIMKTKKDVDSPEYLERIEKANLVFFTGGDQEKLHKFLSGTKLLEILKIKYENEDFILAGTSSGAMVMSENMIISGDGDEAVLKGIIDSKEGLGFIENVIIDTHFLSRGRLSRLAESLLVHNQNIGMGICEDTGVVVTEGRFLRTIGSGTVVIMEGQDIKKTNYQTIKDKDPVFIENLTMHILAKGAGYDLQQRRFLVMEKKHAEKKEPVISPG